MASRRNFSGVFKMRRGRLSLTCMVLFITTVLSGTAFCSEALEAPRLFSEVASMRQDVSAAELIGAKAVDPDGITLGRVEDLLFATNGGVNYAVLSFDAKLGLDRKAYTYPLRDLAQGRISGRVVIETKRDELVTQSGRKLLSLSLRQYDANALIPQRSFVRASDIIGKVLANCDGGRGGVVEDLIVNLRTGNLRYAVAAIGAELYALPICSLDLALASDGHFIGEDREA